MYLNQAAIADDTAMRGRVAQAAAQEGCADAGLDPDQWTYEWRRVWASAPGWDAAWESSLAGHPNDPDYTPGEDPGVITDQMILTQVQAMMPFTRVV